MLKNIVLFSFLVLGFLGCNGDQADPAIVIKEKKMLPRTVTALTDVIIHDIFSPPQAGRIYAYSCIAAYACLQPLHKESAALLDNLNELELDLKYDSTQQNLSLELASIYAFAETGKNLIFSEEKIINYLDSMDSILIDGKVSRKTINRSKEFGKAVADQVLAWSKKDNYNETRSYPKYAINNEAYRWKPTPPAYIDGIEPSWNKIRSFTLESPDQFRPPFPTEYSTDTTSTFYKETMEVYDAVKNAGAEEKAIANFWDCNPYVMNISGHVMLATKKITPGGHWMEIASIVTEKADLDIYNSWYAYTNVSIALSDAFISCWDEKYRSNLVRPETVINEHIDEDWKPLLQTPPFPEYTSGHSVISTAAATVLTKMLGNEFHFTDDSELRFGLPAREFDSFYGASAEAAISRLYGGIHYRPAIDNGVLQGSRIGEYVVSKLGIRSILKEN